MKYVFIFVLMFGLFSCKQKNPDTKAMQKQIDSLKNELAQVYKPSLGFLMNNIQMHHAKLWFAGANQNWKLAQFEIKELKEVSDEIQKYQAQREETKLMDMIEPALTDLSRAVENKNLSDFKKSFTDLTIACNECHKLSDFEYNIVKIPETPAFTNQEFKLP